MAEGKVQRVAPSSRHWHRSFFTNSKT